jgi:hypothetical protein
MLDRVPEITAVEYVPNRAEAMKLILSAVPLCRFSHPRYGENLERRTADSMKTTFDPTRLEVDTGPEPPALEISWYRQSPDDWFRIDYTDPNKGFHAGWHRDEDHADLGRARFQYTADDETEYRAVPFQHETPTLVLWEILERFLEHVLPTCYDRSGRLHGFER